MSLETIAFEAGVTKPIVYARVGGRTDLANALAERLSDRLVAAARTAIDGRPYGREMLAARNVRTLKSRWTHPDLQTPQPPTIRAAETGIDTLRRASTRRSRRSAQAPWATRVLAMRWMLMGRGVPTVCANSETRSSSSIQPNSITSGVT